MMSDDYLIYFMDKKLTKQYRPQLSPLDEKVDKIVPSPIVLYSAGHFIVDFACAFLLYRLVFTAPDAHINVLLYNFCAFALQAPLGIVADKFNRNWFFAAAGCALAAVAYGFWYFPLAAVFCAGLGNAMFHIGGGIDILNISVEKTGSLGVFVSPGALGIFFGATLGRRGDAATLILPVIVALIITMVFIYQFGSQRSIRRLPGHEFLANKIFTPNDGVASQPKQEIWQPSPLQELFQTPQQPPQLRQQPQPPLSPHTTQPTQWLPLPFIAAVCLFLVVCMRSYSGLVLDFPWKSAGIWSIILACAAALGKCLGGILSDRFGKINTAGVSLSIAALLFLLFLMPVTGIAPVAGIAAVLLFNMTMPLTLWAMAKIFKRSKGFSFGLLSFALFIGYLPAYTGISPLPGAAWWFSAAAVVSIPLLFVGLKTVSAFFVSFQSGIE